MAPTFSFKWNKDVLDLSTSRKTSSDSGIIYTQATTRKVISNSCESEITCTHTHTHSMKVICISEDISDSTGTSLKCFGCQSIQESSQKRDSHNFECVAEPINFRFNSHTHTHSCYIGYTHYTLLNSCFCPHPHTLLLSMLTQTYHG